MNVDLAITGGVVVDGTGCPGFSADVGVGGGKICYVGPPGRLSAARTIDATGHAVAPGFIDMHGHSDLALLSDPRHQPKIMQGVTTEVIGQDGLSYAPLTEDTLPLFRQAAKGLNGDPVGLDWDWRSVDEYLHRFDQKVAINVAFLVPHGAVRAAVLGFDDRTADTEQLARMEQIVATAMQEGARGLSTGLTYAPCSYANTEELVRLCKVVAQYGGYFAPHMRCYGKNMKEALEEMLEVAKRAEVPLHLTHFHVSFALGEGKADYYLELVDRGQRDGVELTLDHYPYVAASTFLSGLLPSWSHVGGPERLMDRLADVRVREEIREEMEVTGSDGLMGVPVEWDKIVVNGIDSRWRPEFVGMSVEEIAGQLDESPFDCVAELLIEARLSVSCLLFCGYEDNLQRIMRRPECMMGSDGLLVGERPHPRAWGTFPRFLGRYVRELGVLSLEECVRKMTSLPARRLGLQDRGTVQTGMAADLVVFDPDTVRDTATYEKPKSFPEGIPHVIVNGQVVKDADRQTEVLPGRVLRSHDTGG